MADWNIEELDVFGDKLFELAQKQFPKETKQFLRKQGNELNKQVKKTAKKRVGKNGKSQQEKHTNKRYLTGFKHGRVYRHAASNSYAVRVYNTRPHAHLIEYGHVQLDKDKKPVKHGEKFVKGRFVLQDTGDAFAPEFETAAETFIDDMLDKGWGL